MAPNEQNQHFAEFRQKVCLYVNNLISAPTMFAYLDTCQTQTFCNKKEEKTVSQDWVRQTIGINGIWSKSPIPKTLFAKIAVRKKADA